MTAANRWSPLGELACLLLALVPTAALLLGHSYTSGDFLTHTLPLFHDLSLASRAGEFLVWNPDLYAGYPQAAVAESGSYYPPSLLLSLLFSPLGAYRLFHLLHVWLLVRGVVAFLRELGGSWRAGLVAAAALVLGGVAAHHALHFAVLGAMGWLGPCLWLAACVGRRADPALSSLGLAACYGLLLVGGHPQFTLMAGAASCLTGLLVRSRPVRQTLPWLGLAGGLGLLLGMALVLPLGEYLELFPRHQRGGAAAFVAGNGIELSDLPRWVLAIPGIGRDVPYVGTALLVLAVVGARAGTPLVRAGLVLIGLGLFLAPGGSNPLFRLLAAVPPLSFFREPHRYVWFVQIGLAFLAGAGVDVLRRRSLLRAELACVVGLLALAMVAAAWLGVLRPEPAVLLAVTGCGLAAWGLRLKPGKTLPTLLLGCGLVQLVVPWTQLAPTQPAGVLEEPILARAIHDAGGGRVLDVSLPSEQDLPAVRRLRRNSGRLWGLSYFTGFESLAPLAQEQAASELESALHEDPGAFVARCARLSIRWVVTQEALTVPGVRVAGRDAAVVLYEVLESRPSLYSLSGDEVSALAPRLRERSRWVAQTSAASAGRVVLAQAYYPGWYATVDGQVTELELAEGLYLAVPVSPGAHEVEFAFDNPAAYLGQRLSLAAVLVWGLLLVLALRKRRG